MGSEADEDVTGRNARGVELDDAENWAEKGKGERGKGKGTEVKEYRQEGMRD